MCVGDQIQRGVVIAIAVDSSAARNGLLTDHQITEVSTQLYILAHNSTVRIFFSNYFWCPRSRTFLLLHGGMHYCIRGLHGDVFPSKDSNLSSLVLMGLREIYLMTLMLSFMCPDFRRFPFT